MSRESYRHDPLFKNPITWIENQLITTRLFDPAHAIELWRQHEHNLPIGVVYAPPVVLALVQCYSKLLRQSTPGKRNLRNQIMEILKKSIEYIEARRGTVEASRREHALLYLELGILTLQSHPDVAVQYLEQSRQLNPSDPFTILPLANAYRDSGRLGHANALYQETMNTRPDDPMIMLRLAQLLLLEDQLDQAEKLLSNAREIIVHQLYAAKDVRLRLKYGRIVAYIYLELVSLHKELGDNEGVEKLGREALQLAEDFELPDHVIHKHDFEKLL